MASVERAVAVPTSPKKLTKGSKAIVEAKAAAVPRDLKRPILEVRADGGKNGTR